LFVIRIRDMPRAEKNPQNLPVPVVLGNADSQLRKWFEGKDPNSLSVWRDAYERLEGNAKSDNTQAAKDRDLELFFDYFREKVGSDHVDDWTKPVTAGFLRWLETTPVKRGKKESKRKASSVNRVFSTLRHFAAFVQARRGFLAGSPCAGVKELVTDEPAWKGLSDIEVMRLKSASEQLLQVKDRDNQLPVRDKAVFLLLLNTGLRVSELVGLDRSQYHGKHLKDVKRKGKMRTAKIFLPKEAREALDEYLDKVRGGQAGPLFVTRSGKHLTRQDVDHMLRSLAAQANTRDNGKGKRIDFSAHTLRHTFLRKVAQEHGVEFAMQVSGHASSKYIWRYVKPSDEQTEAALEELF
jgi:site-specific recombinase XerD